MDNLKSQDDKFSKALEFFNNSTVEQKDDMGSAQNSDHNVR